MAVGRLCLLLFSFGALVLLPIDLFAKCDQLDLIDVNDYFIAEQACMERGGNKFWGNNETVTCCDGKEPLDPREEAQDKGVVSNEKEQYYNQISASCIPHYNMDNVPAEDFWRFRVFMDGQCYSEQNYNTAQECKANGQGYERRVSGGTVSIVCGDTIAEGSEEGGGKFGQGDEAANEELPVTKEDLAQRIKDDEAEGISQCEAKEQRTVTCCSKSPGSCISEAVGSTSEKGETIGGVVGAIAQGAAMFMGMGGGISEQCKMMKTLSTTSAGINGSMALLCGNKIRTCNNTCGSAVENIESRVATYEQEYCGVTSGEPGSEEAGKCLRSVQAGVNGVVRELNASMKTCDNELYNVDRMQKQAFQGVAARQMAKECEDAVQTETDFENIGGDPFGTDCSDPANQALPSCQNCSGPNAAQNPACQAFLGGDGNDTNLQVGLGDGDNFNVDDDGTVNNQDFTGNGAMGEGTRVNASSGGGGGGGLGGGSSAGGGAAAGGKGGRGKGKGYNANILKGYEKGNYSSRVGRSGGNSRGYVSSNGRKGNQKGSKYDLKKYLPGQKGGKRGPASARAINRGIASPSSNIWINISKRFQFVCKTNRLHCNSSAKNRTRTKRK